LTASLTGALDEGRVAVAVTGDHAEEFWDDQTFGHSDRRFNNARFQTLMVLHFPGTPAASVPLSTHADLFPTLFDLMGLRVPASEYSDGHSLVREPARDYVVLNGYDFPAAPLFAIATRHQKVLASRTHDFQLEVLAVLSSDDHAVSWSPEEIEPLVHRFQRDVDRFYPGFRLWRGGVSFARESTADSGELVLGPARSRYNPGMRPWDRVVWSRSLVGTSHPEVDVARAIQIGPWVELVGYRLESDTIRLGDAIRIEYVFRCVQSVPEPWDLFFHLEMDQSPGFENIAHEPAHGSHPVRQWQPGEYVRDPHVILSNPDWEPGTARIRVGLCHRETGVRAPIDPRFGDGDSAVVASIRLTAADGAGAAIAK
jgi:hypothetical protein